jgi:tellurite resistance protein TerC
MLLEIVDVHISVYLSFSVIIATLILSILFSIIIPRKVQAQED